MASAVRQRSVSIRELVELHIEQILHVNTQLNAVVTPAFERARVEADALDREAARGEWRGPLHGIPVTIKDSHDTEGIRTTAGTQGWAHRIPNEDSVPVARLRANGAVVLGKTNTPEFTLSFATDNRLFGRTCNPWDLNRSPGGSSGGAAAIVAAGGAAIELGSDLGGSIRVPAAFCGVVGMKPSAGRVPRTGHAFPGGGHLDEFGTIGPVARTVADVALTLRVIAGPDGRDPGLVSGPLGDPGAVRLAGRRALVVAYDGVHRPAPGVEAAVTLAASALAQAGCEVVALESYPDPLLEAFFLASIAMEADGGALVHRLLKSAGTTRPSAMLAHDLAGPNTLGLDMWRRQLRGTGLQRFASVRAFARTPIGTRLTPAQSARLFTDIDRVRAELCELMAQFDLLLTPVACWSAPELAAATECYYTTCAVNLSGLPAVSVPAGSSPNGLPLAVQVIAQPYRDDVALAAALRIEEAVGGFQIPTRLETWPAARA